MAERSPGGYGPSSVIHRFQALLERAHNRLKAFRAVAMRTDKREFVYNGTIDVASIRIWLRHPSNEDP